MFNFQLSVFLFFGKVVRIVLSVGYFVVREKKQESKCHFICQYSTHIDYHYCDFNCCCWSVYFVERYSKLSIRLVVCFYEMWWQDQGCESSVDKFFLLLQFVLLEQRVILNSYHGQLGNMFITSDRGYVKSSFFSVLIYIYIYKFFLLYQK